mmetsp:Transcript_7204/g.13466  ORF Transcript_7204/g.13466 Transcript_7204/m.13466 type:complete len:919 (-) Transcript_7204:135-2891(-)
MTDPSSSPVQPSPRRSRRNVSVDRSSNDVPTDVVSPPRAPPVSSPVAQRSSGGSPSPSARRASVPPSTPQATRAPGSTHDPSSSPLQFSPMTDGMRPPASARPPRHQRSTPASHSQGERTPSRLNSFLGEGLANLSSPSSHARGDLGTASRRRSLSARAQTHSTGGGTPLRAPAADETEENSESGVDATYVWGTTVNVNDASARFKRFLHHFEKPGAAPDAAPFYRALLQEIVETQLIAFNLDCRNLADFDPELYNQLVQYPQEVIPILDIVINDEAAAINAAQDNEELPNRIQVRTYNLLASKQMRDLNPSDIDQMVSVSGMVTRCSGVLPDLKAALFRCLACGHATALQYLDRGRILEPNKCPRPQCAQGFSMSLEHNRCQFANRQQLKMQETPDEMPDGETPQTVNLCVFDDLVDVAKPGDRVQVTGIYRAVPIRTAPNRRTLKSVYKTYLDIIHIKKDQSERMRNETDKVSPEESTLAHGRKPKYQESDQSQMFTEEQIAKFHQIASEPSLYELLVASLAPSIWEMEDIKKGILCLLFGGANNDGAGQNGKFRGELNVLLVGDPGVSKSQLLSYVNKIAPRGIYTSGRGSSAVGLTAYVTKDPETRDMVLESGALVLSDKGVCCIDEFDKMSDSARSMLHEVMEQQTVSVAKAGIICTLNARTSVLASANPIGSRYNPNMSVVDNIQLPPTLLSRFDLIYLVLDKADQTRDRRLAEHLVSLHFAVAPEASQQNSLDRQTLTDYISYARNCVSPLLTDEAADELVEGYVEMRRLGGHKKVITATPRQLESLIRLSESLARMRLSKTVESTDVQEALRLMKSAMKQSCTDPRTGMIDMDGINTGKTSHERFLQAQMGDSILDLMTGGPTSMTDLLQKLGAQTGINVSMAEVRSAVQTLVANGKASVTGNMVSSARV